MRRHIEPHLGRSQGGGLPLGLDAGGGEVGPGGVAGWVFGALAGGAICPFGTGVVGVVIWFAGALAELFDDEWWCEQAAADSPRAPTQSDSKLRFMEDHLLRKVPESGRTSASQAAFQRTDARAA